MTLTPAQVIEGAQIRAVPKAYVLGAYDTRITFYSQQVRALALAHALYQQHHIGANVRIAVIGGGAAGVTLAGALALQGDATVMLFEKADALMPLQRESARRRLDPLIYEWPRQDAEHEFAELPILDWRSGSAIDVRAAVLREFNELRAATEDQIVVKLSHDVSVVVPAGTAFDVHFEREGLNGARESGQTQVDFVIFAFGFGLEPLRSIPNTLTESYWRDAGVPGPEINGKARPIFFVSGNGDGGLIDFVAASNAQFDHGAAIRAIAHRQGIKVLADRLLAIDAAARVADAGGRGFDFVAAYDAQIGDDVARLGLIDEMAARLRPGVQLILQTREPDLMSIRTSTLNRLVAYLVIKACEHDPTRSFEHLVCDVVTSVDPPPGPNQSAYLLDCDGRQIAADKVIVRRGPGRAEIRHPFRLVLEGYKDAHEDWVARFPEESIAPSLSDDAREHFTRLARSRRLPLPKYRQDAIEGNLPCRVKVALRAPDARWSGDLPLGDATHAWGHEGRPLKLLVAASPDELGSLAFAIARLGLHCERATFELDVPLWQPFLENLSCASLNVEGWSLPVLRAQGDDASILNAADLAPAEMASRLHQAMDRWVLNAISQHLEAYLERAEDPGRVVSFRAAADLRAEMHNVWREWRATFEANPELLARFLRLTVCAKDSESHEGEGHTLVGPLMLKQLIRATAVALAVATGWRTMSPQGAPPGNLARASAGLVRTGHACAADLIEGELTAISASKFMWRTHFVVLPMVNGPSGFSILADTSLIKTDSKVPRLSEVDDAANLVITVDAAFMAAVQAGTGPLAALLAAAEEAHFARLKLAIESSEEDGGEG